MKKLILASFVVAAFAPPVAHATTWDLATQFTSGNYSGSAWTYGWEAANGLNGTLTSYDTLRTSESGIKYLWYDFHHRSGDYTPAVGKNTGATTINGVAPGEVVLHPGWDGSFSVARWTAPTSGTFDVNGAFGVGDLGAMSNYISVNRKTSIESLSNLGRLDFTFSRQLSAGDTIDFIVGVPLGGSNGYGSTPLAATITAAVPEPETYAMFLAGLGLMGLLARRKKQAG